MRIALQLGAQLDAELARCIEIVGGDDDEQRAGMTDLFFDLVKRLDAGVILWQQLGEISVEGQPGGHVPEESRQHRRQQDDDDVVIVDVVNDATATSSGQSHQDLFGSHTSCSFGKLRSDRTSEAAYNK